MQSASYLHQITLGKDKHQGHHIPAHFGASPLAAKAFSSGSLSSGQNGLRAQRQETNHPQNCVSKAKQAPNDGKPPCSEGKGSAGMGPACMCSHMAPHSHHTGTTARSVLVTSPSAAVSKTLLLKLLPHVGVKTKFSLLFPTFLSSRFCDPNPKPSFFSVTSPTC